MSKANLLVRLFSAIWGGVDGVRKVLHLVLLLFVFVLFFGAMQDSPLVLPDRAVLVIQPYGFLVEQIEGDPFDRALAELAGDGKPQTLVQDIVDALEYAKDDDRIEVVYLELSSLLGAGLSKLQHLSTAIEDFKMSGKPVIASADFLSQQGYYLAAHADEVYLHPNGMLFLRGYGRFRNYYKDAIDLLRIDWNVFRVGTHKAFVEPYTRMDMSDEDRETTLRLVEQLWSLYQVDVETARELETGTIEDFADNFSEIVEEAGGDLATAAAQYGLVDDLLKRTEIRELLIDYVGPDPDNADSYKAAHMYDYLAQMRVLSGDKVGSKNVAVIVAAGEILFGMQPPGTIGGDSTSDLLRRARNDDSVELVIGNRPAKRPFGKCRKDAPIALLTRQSIGRLTDNDSFPRRLISKRLVDNLLCRVDVLFHQQRRQRQNVADIVEAISHIVGRKITSRLKVDPDKVSYRIVVLHSIQSSNGDSPRILFTFAVVLLQPLVNPSEYGCCRLRLWLRCFLRRHLLTPQHPGDLFPDLSIFFEVRKQRRGNERQLGFRFLGAVAFHAIPSQQRRNRRRVFFLQPLLRRLGRFGFRVVSAIFGQMDRGKANTDQ